jgi:hypothetical protein
VLATDASGLDQVKQLGHGSLSHRMSSNCGLWIKLVGIRKKFAFVHISHAFNLISHKCKKNNRNQLIFNTIFNTHKLETIPCIISLITLITLITLTPISLNRFLVI